MRRRRKTLVSIFKRGKNIRQNGGHHLDNRGAFRGFFKEWGIPNYVQYIGAIRTYSSIHKEPSIADDPCVQYKAPEYLEAKGSE